MTFRIRDNHEMGQVGALPIQMPSPLWDECSCFSPAYELRESNTKDMLNRQTCQAILCVYT